MQMAFSFQWSKAAKNNGPHTTALRQMQPSRNRRTNMTCTIIGECAKHYEGCCTSERKQTTSGCRLFSPSEDYKAGSSITTVSDLDVMLISMCAMMMGNFAVIVVPIDPI